MAKINGEFKSAEGKTIKSYLEENGFSLNRIAVEKNGEIVPRAMYGETVIEAEDVIEIVTFVGGG